MMVFLVLIVPGFFNKVAHLFDAYPRSTLFYVLNNAMKYSETTYIFK